MRIFLDANILFSAAKSAGPMRELVERTLASGHTLCVDAYVVAEARRNLELKAPGSVDRFEALMAKAEASPYRSDDLPRHLGALLPEKDRPVLAAALRLRCAVLVTGDSTHFGALYGRSVEGVAIHSPRSLAEMLGFARRAS